MRIYAAADLHGKQRHLDTIREGVRQCRADVVVLAGDMLSYRLRHDFLRFLDGLPVPVLFVRGNSDPARLEHWSAGSRNVHSLHLNAVSSNGLDFVGLSGTLPLPFHSIAGWHESRWIDQLAPMIHPRAILVAHPPPRGTLDRVLGRFHAGSRGLARLIRATAPAVMICGHIHEAAGVGRIGDTLVVNCALGSKGYGAAIIWTDGQEPRAKML